MHKYTARNSMALRIGVNLDGVLMNNTEGLYSNGRNYLKDKGYCVSQDDYQLMFKAINTYHCKDFWGKFIDKDVLWGEPFENSINGMEFMRDTLLAEICIVPSRMLLLTGKKTIQKAKATTEEWLNEYAIPFNEITLSEQAVGSAGKAIGSTGKARGSAKPKKDTSSYVQTILESNLNIFIDSNPEVCSILEKQGLRTIQLSPRIEQTEESSKSFVARDWTGVCKGLLKISSDILEESKNKQDDTKDASEDTQDAIQEKQDIPQMQ